MVSTWRNSCCGCLRPPWVLAPALGRHRRHGPFHDLEQRLLHALAGDVAGDRRVVRLARDLVDLVDVDDAALGALDVVVGRLQELEDDVLDVLADVAGLGESRRIGNGEGHVEGSRERLGKQCLAAAGGADEQDVRLGELDVVRPGGVIEALVVVVHRDREDALGIDLADDVVLENAADVGRRGHPVARLDERVPVLLANDVHAQLDALVADEHRGAGDELAHLVLALAAERAVEPVLGLAAAGLVHGYPVTWPLRRATR